MNTLTNWALGLLFIAVWAIGTAALNNYDDTENAQMTADAVTQLGEVK